MTIFWFLIYFSKLLYLVGFDIKIWRPVEWKPQDLIRKNKTDSVDILNSVVWFEGIFE